MRNSEFYETLLASTAQSALADELPQAWEVSVVRESDAGEVDFVLTLEGPQKQRVRFAVEVKASASLAASSVVDRLRHLRDRLQMPVLLFAPYLGSALRSALEAEGFSYMDRTGWLYLVSTDPLVLVRGQGASRAPRVEERPSIARLSGASGGRVVRALLSAVAPMSAERPLGVRELAHLAGVAPGTASKVLATLQTDGVVERDELGRIADVHRVDMLRRWVLDYSFERSNRDVTYALAPRGLDALHKRLRNGEVRGALTGSLASRALLPAGITSVVPLTLAALYVPEVEGAMKALQLVETDRATANVILAVPQDLEILPDAHVALAPYPLILADLLTLPGRGDAEAEQLMEALEPRSQSGGGR